MTYTREMKVNDFQKEQRKKDFYENAENRSRMVNWGDRYTPKNFMTLISDEQTNRIFLKWVSQWKPLLFQVLFNICMNIIVVDGS